MEQLSKCFVLFLSVLSLRLYCLDLVSFCLIASRVDENPLSRCTTAQMVLLFRDS
jgi:hypothetical protein